MNENAIERPALSGGGASSSTLAGRVTFVVGCGWGTQSEAAWTFADDRNIVRSVPGDTRTVNDLAKTIARWRTVI